METVIFPPSLYDLLLDAILFETDEEVRQRVVYHLSRPPKDSKKAKRALSHLLSTIINHRRRDLLESLLEPLRQHSVPVDGSAVKAAAALPVEEATGYLATLFTLGWDINKALSNTEPPLLSIALHDISLTRWLLESGADPNAACDIDFTPLSVAVHRSTMTIVHLLLQYSQHSHNGHLVYYATQRADTDESVGMIRLLHKHNKPIDDILFQDPKSYRLRAPFLRGTPLYYACEQDKPPIALTLLALGADPDKACVRYDQSVGPSPRQVAMQHGWDFF